jgi:hypothetical protein
MRKIWLLQFVANALIVFAFYEWLAIPDSRTSQLTLSFVLGAAILAGMVFLHSRTFHIKPLHFALALLIFLLVSWGLSSLNDKVGLWIASTLTYRLRKPVRPEYVYRILWATRWVIQWILVPLLLLRKRSPRFWLQYTAVVLVALLVPSLLIHWTPKLTSTALQITSFLLRFGMAYCLVTTGFAALWRLTESGSPVVNQPSAAALP